jgi:hypothetical protein
MRDLPAHQKNQTARDSGAADIWNVADLVAAIALSQHHRRSDDAAG